MAAPSQGQPTRSCSPPRPRHRARGGAAASASRQRAKHETPADQSPQRARRSRCRRRRAPCGPSAATNTRARTTTSADGCARTCRSYGAPLRDTKPRACSARVRCTILHSNTERFLTREPKVRRCMRLLIVPLLGGASAAARRAGWARHRRACPHRWCPAAIDRTSRLRTTRAGRSRQTPLPLRTRCGCPRRGIRDASCGHPERAPR